MINPELWHLSARDGAEILSNPQWAQIICDGRAPSVTLTYRDLVKDVVRR